MERDIYVYMHIYIYIYVLRVHIYIYTYISGLRREADDHAVHQVVPEVAEDDGGRDGGVDELDLRELAAVTPALLIGQPGRHHIYTYIYIYIYVYITYVYIYI